MASMMVRGRMMFMHIGNRADPGLYCRMMAGSVRRPCCGRSMASDCARGAMRMVMRWLGQTVSRQDQQSRERQNCRYGGVQTHHDFGGAERQSNSYPIHLSQDR